MSNLKTILVLYSIIFSCSLFAQPGFNQLIEVGSMNDMLVVNDTIIGYGYDFGDTMNNSQVLYLTKFDSNGVLLDYTVIEDSLGGGYFSLDKTWGKIIPTSDGGYAMTAATVFRKSSFLIKADADLNIEFIKEYHDTVNVSNFDYKVFEIEDGYILYGTIQQPDLVIRPFVRKVDKEGNTLWFNLYGETGKKETFITGGLYQNNHFIFGGIKAWGAKASTLRVVDTDGEVAEERSVPLSHDMGYLRRLEVLDDGRILVHGQYEVTVGQEGMPQPTLALLDQNLEFEWVRQFGLIDEWEKQIAFWDMESLGNGEFMGAGQGVVTIDGEEVESGWMMKFNIDGDSIWSRYELPDFTLDSLFFPFHAGIGQLSSGNIIIGGRAQIWNRIYTWLFKVTPDGCVETINCGLVPTFSTPRSEESLSLHLSPNPASDRVKVAWASPIGKATLRLYNLQGHLVGEREVAQAETEALFDVSSLPSGVYFMEIKDGEGRFNREKLLVLD